MTADPAKLGSKVTAAEKEVRRSDRLIELKALDQPANDYSVMWDDLTAPTKEDRMAMVKIMAETNQVMFMEGGLYTRDQMLSEAGFEVEE